MSHPNEPRADALRPTGSEPSALDTSGAVDSPPGTTFGAHMCLSWSDLSPFAQGYIEAAFESITRPITGPFLDNEREGKFARFSDLAPATLAAMLKDCEAYEKQGRAFGLWTGTPEQGAVFWRWRGISRDDLFPPLTLSLGDDGLIYSRTPADTHRDRKGKA